MTDVLQFEFRPDPAEMARASKALALRSRFGWVQHAIWPMLAALAVLYLASGADWRDLGLLYLVAATLAAGQLLAPRLERRRFERLIAETPSLREPQVYVLDAEGLRVAAGGASSALRWDAIVEAREAPDGFLLLMGRQTAHLLPRRAVGGPAEQEALREFLRRRLGARAGALASGSPSGVPT
jgi:hypothetical protein